MTLYVLEKKDFDKIEKETNVIKITEDSNYVVSLSEKENTFLNYHSLLNINLIDRKIIKDNKNKGIYKLVDNYFISLSTLCRKD